MRPVHSGSLDPLPQHVAVLSTVQKTQKDCSRHYTHILYHTFRLNLAWQVQYGFSCLFNVLLVAFVHANQRADAFHHTGVCKHPIYFPLRRQTMHFLWLECTTLYSAKFLIRFFNVCRIVSCDTLST